MGDEQHSGCLILNIPHNPGSMVGNLVTVQGGAHTHTPRNTTIILDVYQTDTVLSKKLFWGFLAVSVTSNIDTEY